MKPLFSPQLYSESTKLLEKYVVSYDEESKSVSINDVSSDNKLIKKLENSETAYIDKTNFYVWVITESNKNGML